MEETKAVEIRIDADEVVKRYPVTEAIEVVRCRTSILFHSTGFYIVSRPTLANNLKGGALFETLKWYCDYQDGRAEYSSEEQEKLDTLCAVIVNILTLPLDVFTDAEFCLDMGNTILEKRNAFYEKVWKEAEKEKPETLEDAIEDANFAGEIAVTEELGKEIEMLASNGKTKQRAS